MLLRKRCFTIIGTVGSAVGILDVTRINAAARLNGTTYSQLMCGLKDKNINLDRKVLAHLAVHEPEAFKVVVEQTDR